MTHETKKPEPSLSVLRVYLRRRTTKPGRGLWGQLFRRSYSYDLVERALRAGVTYATVTLGHAGFVAGAKSLVADTFEIAPTTLPTCVELVAPPHVLEAFVGANREELLDAVLLRMDGVQVSLVGGST